MYKHCTKYLNVQLIISTTPMEELFDATELVSIKKKKKKIVLYDMLGYYITENMLFIDPGTCS